MTKINKSVAHRGFTLIELMIVVAIIGILAAVAVPKFAEMIRKSKEGATKGSLSALRSALTIYLSDNEGLSPLALTDINGSDLNDAATNQNQNNAETYFQTAMIPKYIETMPYCKLGTYHPDSQKFYMTNSSGTSPVNRNDYVFANFNNGGAGTILHVGDNNGWMYITTNDASIWVNCSHTDTKQLAIEDW